MKIFHKHQFIIAEKSNAIQYDNMGYPLRLCLVKCKCGMSKQLWIDTSKEFNDVVVNWQRRESESE